MSFLAINNVLIVDKTYGQPANNYGDLMEIVELYKRSSPYSMGIFNAKSAPGIPPAIDVFGANDQGVAINAASLDPSVPSYDLLALVVTQRYINFNQGNEHKMSVKFAATPAGIPDNRTMEFIITPQAGVDSTSEFVIITMMPDLIFPSPQAGINPWDTIPAPKFGTKGFLHPWHFEGSNFISIKFEGCGDTTKVDITVQTLWLNSDSVKTAGQMLIAGA
jgi:hypothetical protein